MTPSHKQVFLTVLTAVLLLVTATAYGQAAGKDNLGKEFYVAFAANQGADSTDDDTTVFALYLTGPVAAKGYVEVPAIGFRADFTTTPGQITTIYLPDGDGLSSLSVEVQTSEWVASGMGVHVVADTEIAVYGMSHKRYSSDAFMAMPVDVLGTEYRAISYPTSTLQNFNASDTPGEFWIVGAHDSTNISITPSARTATNRPAGVRFDILLNRGDVYLVQGDRNDPSNDLTGSLIEAELPIAVFSGHERTEIPKGVRNLDPENPSVFQSTSRDHLIEQLPPVSAWGDSALVIPFATSDNPDLVRIVSAEDGNTISINGGAIMTTLNAGKFYEIRSLGGPTSISAAKPILVGQYMHTSKFGLNNEGELDPVNPAYGDPALALVYPVEQFAKSYTFISVVNARAFLGNFVNIVVEQSGIAGMVLDGVPIAASQFKAIPGSSFVYAQIQLAQGTHNISGNSPFGITVYAMGGVDSYAYTGGTLLKTITPFKTADLIIDFGDRILDDTLGGSWDTTVFLQNISSDPLTIFNYFTRTGDVTKFSVTDPTPITMTAGEKGSMTIRFEPREADRRMHTIIQAKTEHLRAFVVDVYGRGVLARPNTFAKPSSTIPIDTIDFGIHGENSPPYDTLAYIINKGSADMLIDTLTISGPDAADFSFLGASIQSVPSPLPFLVQKTSTDAARLDLRFTPSLPRAKRLAFLDYSSPTNQRRRVVLIAHVDSIELAAVTPVTFDSILICESDDGTITIFNPNTFTVRLLNLDIAGPNASDFSVQTPVPIDILSNQTVTIRLRFAPNTPGLKTATVTASFDIPTGGKRSFQIQAIAKQLQSAFWAPTGTAILGNEEVLFPIYARSDLGRYQSKSFTVDISYDPTYIEDVEPNFENTLNPFMYYEIEGFEPGSRRYICRTYDNSYLSGGGPTELKPLITILFKGLISTADIVHTYAAIDINYKVTFGDSPLPTHCIASDPPPGRITLDSACGPVHVIKQVGIPNEMFMDYPSPNPVVNGPVALYLYLSHNAVARVDVIDMLGNRVATAFHERKDAGIYKVLYNTSQLPQGQYFLRFEAGGKVKTRRLSIVR